MVASHGVASLTGWTAEGGLHIIVKFLELGLGGWTIADDRLPECVIIHMAANVVRGDDLGRAKPMHEYARGLRAPREVVA